MENQTQRESLSCGGAKELIQNAPAAHQTDRGAGDVLFDVVDSMERFALERIILVAKEVAMDEDLLVAMLQANQGIASKSRGRMGSRGTREATARRPREPSEKDLTAQSLADSGLL